ncbi:protein disulfide isomerase CRELD2 isoform X5 [Camelus ferus]|uniref:Protein disulfide isomerase CRELD2 isoform X5 n=1 Tax=Camelus ferus TaxID=419612 RepID=A0A8B8U1X9_CAMFR|nr:protein disulfide isomerase CRELD2 isoform X5 [Camelus ferus]
MLPRAPAALGLLLLLLLPPPPPGEATKKPTPCKRCRELVDKFNQGMVDTAKKNFGGGNTAWEEKTLSKYEFSEVRLLEIVEGLCGSSDFECNQLVEEHEEHLEAWWLQLKKKYPDLFEWFCVKTLKVCCSPGTYGPDCLGTFFRGDPRVSCIIPAIPVVIPSVPRRVRAALQREWPLQWRRQQTGGRDLPVPPGLPGATVHRLHSRVLQRAEERHPQRLHRGHTVLVTLVSVKAGPPTWSSEVPWPASWASPVSLEMGPWVTFSAVTSHTDHSRGGGLCPTPEAASAQSEHLGPAPLDAAQAGTDL